MRERLTDRAHRVVDVAMSHARSLRHPTVGIGHLLLGVLREGSGVASAVLITAGVDEDRVSRELVRLPSGTEGAHLSPGTKTGLTLAVAEADRLGHKFVGPDDLLLAVLHTEEATSPLLDKLGLEVEKFRSEVVQGIERTRALMYRPTGPIRPQRSLTRKLSESLSQESRKFMQQARREAMESESAQVSSGHLLLALLANEESPVGALLREEKLEIEALRAVVRSMRGAQLASATASPSHDSLEAYTPSSDPFTEEAKGVLALAAQEAEDLGDAQVAPRHLLLGVLKHGGCTATRALLEHGCDLHRLAARVEQSAP